MDRPTRDEIAPRAETDSVSLFPAIQPAAYQDNVFESCQGDNQDFPGVYTVNGQGETSFHLLSIVPLAVLVLT